MLRQQADLVISFACADDMLPKTTGFSSSLSGAWGKWAHPPKEMFLSGTSPQRTHEPHNLEADQLGCQSEKRFKRRN